MKALVLEAPFTLNMKEIPVPEVPQDWALIKMKAISICGSDIHAFKGNSLLLTYPRVLGHELCGSVLKLNGISKEVKVGDNVCILPYISCGTCRPCRLGRENCCTSLKVLGVHIDGGIAEYIAVPIAALMKLPDDMDPRVAALIEPLSVSAHCVRRGKIGCGDKVLILGAGPIGLGAAESSRAAGADVRIADLSLERRRFVSERFGYITLDPAQEGFDQTLRNWTDGEYPNKVIDSTGNKTSNANAVNYLSSAGDLIFVGLQSGTLDISDPALHIREGTVYASRVAQISDFRYVLENILNGTIRAERMITDQCRFSDVKESFENWVTRGGEVFKGIVQVP